MIRTIANNLWAGTRVLLWGLNSFLLFVVECVLWALEFLIMIVLYPLYIFEEMLERVHYWFLDCQEHTSPQYLYGEEDNGKEQGEKEQEQSEEEEGQEVPTGQGHLDNKSGT